MTDTEKIKLAIERNQSEFVRICEHCFEHDCNNCYEKNYHVLIDEGLKGIRDNNAVIDAVPVVHGRWISVEDDVLFRCSRCDSEISTDWDYDQADMWNYCPHCGAKMDNAEQISDGE